MTEPTQPCVLLEVADRVATVRLNRPERRNAWTPDMEVAFGDAVRQAAADPAVRVIIITGAGNTFCPGADMARLAVAPATPMVRPVSNDDFAQRYSWMLAIDKPLIAAINGAVAGVGLCLTLYCDFRFMADDARLSTSFVRRGLIAEHGSAWLLPRLVGPMHAADLLLSGRTLSATEAAHIGLVLAIPRAEFWEAVMARAADLATYASPRSIRIIKAQLRNAWRQTLAEATQEADAETARCRDSADYREGVASFKEKREPAFTGQ